MDTISRVYLAVNQQNRASPYCALKYSPATAMQVAVTIPYVTVTVVDLFE